MGGGLAQCSGGVDIASIVTRFTITGDARVIEYGRSEPSVRVA